MRKIIVRFGRAVDVCEEEFMNLLIPLGPMWIFILTSQAGM